MNRIKGDACVEEEIMSVWVCERVYVRRCVGALGVYCEGCIERRCR